MGEHRRSSKCPLVLALGVKNATPSGQRASTSPAFSFFLSLFSHGKPTAAGVAVSNETDRSQTVRSESCSLIIGAVIPRGWAPSPLLLFFFLFSCHLELNMGLNTDVCGKTR